MAKGMEWYDYLAYVLLVIGGLNWLLVGWFSFNLVDWVFGVKSVMATIIYTLVGLSAVYGLISLFRKK